MPPRIKKTAGEVAVGTDAPVAMRLAAIAALHQPIVRRTPASSIRGYELEPAREDLVCGECKTQGRSYDAPIRAPWPCATARLCGTWPSLEGG